MTARRSAAVYEFPDRLIIIADHLTEAGFWRDGSCPAHADGIRPASPLLSGRSTRRCVSRWRPPPGFAPGVRLIALRDSVACESPRLAWSKSSPRAMGHAGGQQGVSRPRGVGVVRGPCADYGRIGEQLRQGLALSLWPPRLRWWFAGIVFRGTRPPGPRTGRRLRRGL